MNIFNRIVMVLLLLGIIALVVVTLLWPFPTLAVARGLLAQAEANITPFTWPYILGGGIAIALLCFVLIILELRRPRRKTVKISKVSGGKAYLLTESVGRRLAWHIGRLADVTKVEPVVRGRGNGVDVRLEVETTPHVEIPMKTDEILAVVHQQVEEKMGLRLRHAEVLMRSATFPKEPAYAKSPTPEPWHAPAVSTPPASEDEKSL